MAYDKDLEQFMSQLTTRLGNVVGCHVQKELEGLTSINGVDISQLKQVVDIIDQILDGDNTDSQSAERNIIGMIKDLKATVESGAYDGEDGEDGEDGKSAYELWKDQGNTGTVEDFLNSLKAIDGEDGNDGLSAYELAKGEGFTGSLGEWIASLKGAKGDSAYQIALNNGFDGSEAEWLASLVGKDGKSAYQIAKAAGFQGTEQEWLDSLQGTNGKSAYQSAKENGFEGTEQEWLASLHAPDVDVSQFYNKTEVNDLLDGKVDKSEVSDMLLNVESFVGAFSDGISVGKAAHIAGNCDKLSVTNQDPDFSGEDDNSGDEGL